MFALILFSFQANADNYDLVKVTEVEYSEHFDGSDPCQFVTVTLTRYASEIGVKEVLVCVKPHNTVLSLFFDLREGKKTTLTSERPTKSVKFECRASGRCGKSDFDVQIIDVKYKENF